MLVRSWAFTPTTGMYLMNSDLSFFARSFARVRDDLLALNSTIEALVSDPDVLLNDNLNYFYSEDLEQKLRHAARRAEILFELAGLPSRRKLLAKAIQKHEGSKKGLGETYFLQEEHAFVSPAQQSILDQVTAAMDVFSVSAQDSVWEYKRRRLEECLASLPHHVFKRGLEPTSEREVQELLDELLGVLFVDYLPEGKINIAGAYQNWKPDGGIRSIKTLVELKFVATERELARAAEGIAADVGGYRGSGDWTSFISVFYMTGAYTTAARLNEELSRFKAEGWIGIAVVGRGRTEKREKTTAKKTTANTKKKKK